MSLDFVLAVWAGLLVFAVGWSVAIAVAGPRLPSASDVVGFFLRSWPGRYVLLALWSYLGWHLFCQRP